MKKIFLSVSFIALAVSAVLFANGKSSVDDEALLTSNVEALSRAYEFDGTEWTDEGSHLFGKNWRPVLKTCTYNSGSFSFNVSVGYKGIADVGVGYNTSSYSRPGHLVECLQGNGNCFNGTGCVAD